MSYTDAGTGAISACHDIKLNQTSNDKKYLTFLSRFDISHDLKLA